MIERERKKDENKREGREKGKGEKLAEQGGVGAPFMIYICVFYTLFTASIIFHFISSRVGSVRTKKEYEDACEEEDAAEEADEKKEGRERERERTWWDSSLFVY